LVFNSLHGKFLLNILFFVVRMEKITRFEKTRLMSARALQLALGAPLLVKADHSLPMDELAEKELNEGVLPLVVLREYPNGKVERIEVS
jgi:DNA-directed RNA polymerase subunit K/omega